MPQGLPKALSEDEVTRLLDAVVGDDAVARRDRAMLELLYGTGMRISELVGLSLGDLALDDGVLRAFGKGAKERLVPIGRFAGAALTSWLGAERPRRHGRRPGGAAGATPRRCSSTPAAAGCRGRGPGASSAATATGSGSAPR